MSRQTDASSAAEIQQAVPRLHLQLLDGFNLTRGNVCVELPAGAQHLLAYLAVSNRAVRRAHVAGELWDNVPDGRAAGNLRSAIWRLRQLDLDLIYASGDFLSLHAAIGVDLKDLQRLGRTLIDPASDVASLELDDLPLKGELLPGWSYEWVLLERERHRQISLHVLDMLCERWTAQRQHVKAVRAGLAAVAGEPLRESSNRALIMAYVAEGNPTEAIRHFGLYRQTLRRELDLEPSPQMFELVRSFGAVTAG